MKIFIRDFLAVLKSKVFNTILAFCIVIIYARFLGPEGSGVLAGILIYPIIFISFATLGLRQSAVYFVGKDINPPEMIFSTVITVWIITSIISVTSCIYLLKYVSQGPYSTLMIGITVTAIPFSIFTDYGSGIILGKNKIKDFATINWVPNLFRLLGAGVFVWYLNWGVEGALIAFLISSVLMSGLVFYLLSKLIQFRYTFNPTLIKSMLRLGITYSIALFVVNLNYKVDQILLEHYSTAYNLGIYEKGVVIVEKIWEIPMLLSTLIFAGSANAKNSTAYSSKVARLLRISLIVCAILLLILIFIAPWIVRLFFGTAFLDSASVIQLLAPGVFFMVIFKVLNMDLAGRGKPWLSLTAMLPAVVLNIILNIFLIPKYGFEGVAIASTISYSVGAIIFLIVYLNETSLNIKDVLVITNGDMKLISQKIFNRYRRK